MGAFLARRLLWALAVLALVWVLTFILAYVVPGDAARSVAGGVRASPADVARVRASLGLDQPLLEQMLRYLQRLSQGDLGYSFSHRRPVLDLILQRVPATLELAAAGLLLQLVIGLPLGVFSATRRGRWGDRLATIFSSVSAAMPAFWLGYLLLLLLAFLPAVHFGLNVLPIGGYAPFSLQHLLLPALTLGIVGSAYYTRLLRASLLEELSQQYILAARSIGISERRLVWSHALRNALNPVVTQVGLDMGLLLGGVIVVERVFSWPGVGKLAVDSVTHGDVPVIMGTVLLATLFIVLANIAADVVNATLDPRIRLER